MAKPLKIEQLRLQSVVAKGISEGKNPQEIAVDCSREAKQPISNMAVRRYLESIENGDPTVTGQPVSATVQMERKHEVVRKDEARIAKLVDRDIDLIDLQFQTTKALADRFEWIAALPDRFEERIGQLRDLLRQEDFDTATLDHWGLGFTLELRRNIGNMAALNRELRENSKFIATLREKAFEFNLIQEYLMLFLDCFKQAEIEVHGTTTAYERAEMQIAANPRMQRIVEQQQQMRGYDGG